MQYEDFGVSLDTHISEKEYNNKIQNKSGYVLFIDNNPIGLLRYNLFWDNTPFCNLLYIIDHYQGYGMLLTSTQVDEEAPHFYRKLGYKIVVA